MTKFNNNRIANALFSHHNLTTKRLGEMVNCIIEQCDPFEGNVYICKNLKKLTNGHVCVLHSLPVPFRYAIIERNKGENKVIYIEDCILGESNNFVNVKVNYSHNFDTNKKVETLDIIEKHAFLSYKKAMISMGLVFGVNKVSNNNTIVLSLTKTHSHDIAPTGDIILCSSVYSNLLKDEANCFWGRIRSFFNRRLDISTITFVASQNDACLSAPYLTNKSVITDGQSGISYVDSNNDSMVYVIAPWLSMKCMGNVVHNIYVNEMYKSRFTLSRTTLSVFKRDTPNNNRSSNFTDSVSDGDINSPRYSVSSTDSNKSDCSSVISR